MGAYDEMVPYVGRIEDIWVRRFQKILRTGVANNEKTGLARQATERVMTGHSWKNNGQSLGFSQLKSSKSLSS